MTLPNFLEKHAELLARYGITSGDTSAPGGGSFEPNDVPGFLVPIGKEMSRFGFDVGGGPQIIVGGTFTAPDWQFGDPDVTPPNLKWLQTAINDCVQDFSGATSITFKNIGGSTELFGLNNKNAPLLASIDLGSFAYAQNFFISTGNALTSLKADRLVTAVGFSLSDNFNLPSLSLPSLRSVTDGSLDCANDGRLVSVSLPLLESVAGILNFFEDILLTSINLDSLVTVHGQILVNACTSLVNFPQLPSIKRIDGSIEASNCALSQESVDYILATLVGLDGSNGTTLYQNQSVILNNGTSAEPSEAGLDNKAILESRGCTVFVNVT